MFKNKEYIISIISIILILFILIMMITILFQDYSIETLSKYGSRGAEVTRNSN